MLQLDGHEMTYMEEKASRLKEDCKANQKAQLNAFNLNLGRIQDRQDRLTDAYIDRMIDKEVYERRRESLLMEKIEIEERLSEFKVGGGSVQEKMSKFLEQLKSLNLSYENGIPEEKRDLLKIVTSNRKVDGKNVVIELNFPFQEVASRHENPQCGYHRDRPRTFYLDKLFDRLISYFKSIKDKEEDSKEG